MEDDDEDELRMLFEGCDSNANGSLQYTEFVALLQNLNADMEEKACRIGFREIDSDRDGHIDFAEFFRWWQEL
jgi:calmodulin